MFMFSIIELISADTLMFVGVKSQSVDKIYMFIFHNVLVWMATIMQYICLKPDWDSVK